MFSLGWVELPFILGDVPMADDDNLSVGDFYEGVLLETCRDENQSIIRPRVRPLEYFPERMRVEFPRTLREKYPIGTRFRADVTVGQKHWSNGVWREAQSSLNMPFVDSVRSELSE
jgi:hypothetical protein